MNSFIYWIVGVSIIITLTFFVFAACVGIYRLAIATEVKKNGYAEYQWDDQTYIVSVKVK